MTYWQANDSQQATPNGKFKQYGSTEQSTCDSNQPITINTSDEDELHANGHGTHEHSSLLLLTPTSSNHARDRLMRFFTPDHRVQTSKRDVRQFYASQNEFINSLIELSTVDHNLDDDYEQPSTAAYLAIQISLATTFLLLAMKLFAAIYSGSISVVASAFDSVLDLLSQGTLLLIHRFMIVYDPFNYPASKSRFEPVSILIFSIIMGIAALALLFGSIQSLITGSQAGADHVLRMDSMTVTVLVAVIVIQSCMWMYCKRVAAMPIPGASAAAALADDHFNDVVITLFGGIPAILAGSYSSVWYFDSFGGILISLYIAVRWVQTAIDQIPLLVGRAAPPSFLNQLTYLAATHDDRIKQIDTIQAYHSGLSFLCEIHIVLPEDMPLREAHDIGESLETKIEKHPMVHSAFVHLDFETSHAPEHAARARAAGKAPVKRQNSASKVVPFPGPSIGQSGELPAASNLGFTRSQSAGAHV